MTRRDDARDLQQLARENPPAAIQQLDRVLELLVYDGGSIAARLATRAAAANALGAIVAYDRTALEGHVPELADVLADVAEMRLADVDTVAGNQQPRTVIIDETIEALAHTVTREGDTEAIATEAHVERLVELDRQGLGGGFALWCLHSVAHLDPELVAPHTPFLVGALSSSETARVDGALVTFKALAKTLEVPASVEWPADALLEIATAATSAEHDFSESTGKYAAETIEALSRAHAPALRGAVPTLVELLDTTAPPISVNVAAALSNLASEAPDTVGAFESDIVAALEDSNTETTARLLAALRDLGDAEDVETEPLPDDLEQYLTHEELTIQLRATELLNERLPVPDDRLEPLVAPLVTTPLAADDESVRRAAAVTLRHIEEANHDLLTEYTDQLAEYLEQTDDPLVRSVLSGILGQHVTEDSAITEPWDDPKLDIDGHNTTLANQITDPGEMLADLSDEVNIDSDVEELFDELDAESPRVRQRASVGLLTKIGGGQASAEDYVAELATALEDHRDEFHEPLATLVTVSLPLGTEAATRRLIERIDLSTFDDEVRKAGVVIQIHEALENEYPQLLTEFLSRHRDLIGSWRDASEPVLVGIAATVFGTLAAAEAAETEPYVTQFAGLADAESPHVRGTVAENFNIIARTRPQVVANYESAIQTLFDDPDAGARYNSVSAVAAAAVERPRLVEPYLDGLVRSLDDETDRVRASALEAIGRYTELAPEDTVGWVDVFVSRLSDENVAVRERAALTLVLLVTGGHTDPVGEHVGTVTQVLSAVSEPEARDLVAMAVALLGALLPAYPDRVVESIDFDDLDAVLSAVGFAAEAPDRAVPPEATGELASAVGYFSRMVIEHGDPDALPDSVRTRVEELAQAEGRYEPDEFFEDLASWSTEPARDDQTAQSGDDSDEESAAPTADTEGQDATDDPSLTELAEVEPVREGADGDVVVDGTAYVLDEAQLIDALGAPDREQAPVRVGLKVVAESRPDDLVPYVDELATALEPAGEADVALLEVFDTIAESAETAVAAHADRLCRNVSHSDPRGRVAITSALRTVTDSAVDEIRDHDDEFRACVRQGGQAGRYALAILGRASQSDRDILRLHTDLIVEAVADEELLPVSALIFADAASEFPAELARELDQPISVLDSPSQVETKALERCVGGLGLLGSKEPDVLQGQLPVLEGLLTTTYAVDPDVRERVFHCLQMLAEVDPASVVEAVDLENVADFVTHDEIELQHEAIRLLGLTTEASPRAVGAAAAGQLLGALEASDDETTLTLASQVLLDVCYPDGEPAEAEAAVVAPYTGRIVSLLPEVDPEIRAKLLKLLVPIARADPSYVVPYAESITAELESDHAAVRRDAVVVCASIVPDRERLPVGHLEAILSVLGDTDERIAKKSALKLLFALSRTEPDRLEELIDALPLYLADEDTRQNTVKVLFSLAKRTPEAIGSSTVHALADLAVQADDAEIIQAALRTIDHLSDPEVIVAAVNPLLTNFDHLSEAERMLVMKALQPVARGLAPELTPYLDTIVDHLHEDELSRNFALNVLALTAKDTPDAAVPHTETVLEFAADDDERCRKSAMGFASNVATESPEQLVAYVETIAARLDDPSPEARRYALGALWQVAGESPEAVAAVESAVVAQLDADDSSIARRATRVIDVLLESGTVAPREAIVTTLVAPTDSPDLRRQRTEALQTIADRDAATLTPEKQALQRRAAVADTETATTVIDILSRVPSRAVRSD